MSKLEELIQEYCPDGVEYKKLGDIAEIGTGIHNTQDAVSDGKYIFYVRSQEPLALDTYDYDDVSIITAGDGVGVGKVFHITNGKYALHQRAYRIHIKHSEYILTDYVFHYMKGYFLPYILQQSFHGSVTSVRRPMLNNFEIPVPPLPVQQEIVRILDSFSKLEQELEQELEQRKKQYEHYRNVLIPLEVQQNNDHYKQVTLPEISQNFDFLRKPVTKGNRKEGPYPYYGASGVVDHVADYIFDGDYLLVSEDGANLTARVTPIAFSISGKSWVNNHAHILKFDNPYIQKYVEIYLNAIDLSRYISGGAQPKLNQQNLNNIQVMLPDEQTLVKTVDILTTFDSYCTDLTSGLPAEIALRKKQYEYYRERLLSFPRKA